MSDRVSLVALIRLFYQHRIEVKVMPYKKCKELPIVEIRALYGNFASPNEYLLYDLDDQLIISNTSHDWEDIIEKHRELAARERLDKKNDESKA